MKTDIVNYRRARARETLDEAKIMFRENKLFATVNRCYYACFYEVLALLFIDGFSAPKHSGIKSIFTKEFVKSGKVEQSLGRFYSKMFEHRQKGDYVDMISFEYAEVASWLEKTEIFIKELEKLFADKPD